MAVSKAQQRAVHKYVKENYDRQEITLPKGKKAIIKAHAAMRGESVNGFISRAIEETIKRDSAGGDVYTMSEKEQAKQIIDRLPDYKLHRLLVFLRGIEFDDELEDDLFCEQLYQKYLDDPDPDKTQTITLEELAAREGVEL